MTKTYLITPGELSGIGLEITLKALSSIEINDSYIFYTKEVLLHAHSQKISLNFDPLKISEVQTGLKPGVYFIDSQKEPVDWFKEACSLCAQYPRELALITGPLTKASFKDSKILGHTEYLRSLYKNSPLFMTFFGEAYNCLLLNDHIPLGEVSSSISQEKIKEALELIAPFSNSKKNALLGLNPHAGEGGLLGSEELNIHNSVCSEQDSLEGPLSPDGFFSEDLYRKYNFIIANYHDQGLIPFKLINGFKASQATLGLPFVRTSVDHGTSEALYMKFTANPESMIHAIELAQNLLKIKSMEN